MNSVLLIVCMAARSPPGSLNGHGAASFHDLDARVFMSMSARLQQRGQLGFPYQLSEQPVLAAPN
jgi:hypothetical protein